MEYRPETIKEITDNIKKGLSNRDACICAGISERTFYTWRDEHPEFKEALEQALAEFKRFHLNLITKASVDGQWTASAWLMERKFKKEFGKFVTLTGDETEPITFIFRDGVGVMKDKSNGNGGKGEMTDGRDK